MCITTPGKIISIAGNMAKVEINGLLSDVRIDLVEVKAGDYVYCAAGMAVEKADL